MRLRGQSGRRPRTRAQRLRRANYSLGASIEPATRWGGCQSQVDHTACHSGSRRANIRHAPLPAAADRARIRRTGGRIGSRRLARMRRPGEPAFGRVRRRGLSGQSAAPQDRRTRRVPDARCNRQAGRPGDHRDAAARGCRGPRIGAREQDRRRCHHDCAGRDRPRGGACLVARDRRGRQAQQGPGHRARRARRRPPGHRAERDLLRARGASRSPRAGRAIGCRGDGDARFRDPAGDRILDGDLAGRRHRCRIRRVARLPAARPRDRRHPALRRGSGRCAGVRVGAACRRPHQAGRRAEGRAVDRARRRRRRSPPMRCSGRR